MWVIGVIALVGMLVLTATTWRSNSSVGTALQQSEERSRQLAVVNEMNQAQSELVLAAMDSIVDKDEGVISPERLSIIAESCTFLRENVGGLLDLADTEAEKQEAARIQENLGPLTDFIQVKLPKLIEENGKLAKETIAQFDEIDDVLDEQGGKIEQTLDTVEASVRQRLEAGGGEKLLGAVELVGELRAVHLELMLAAMDSIIDKNDGEIAPERLEIIKKSAALLKSKKAELQTLATTTEEQQFVGAMGEALEKLEQGILVDLAELIATGSQKALAIEAAFVEIDDVLDVQGDGVADTLDAIEQSVRSWQDGGTAASDTIDLIAQMRTTHLQLMLAAMDSIIDKDEGKVEEGRLETINSAVESQQQSQQKLLAQVRTPEEKKFVDDLGSAIDGLAEGVQLDLVELIEKSAAEVQAIEAAFVAIDDTLDEHGDGYSEALAGLASSVHDRLANSDVAGLTKTIDLIADMRSTHLVLMLAAMDSIIDRHEGRIEEGRLADINEAIATQTVYQKQLVEMMDTTENKRLAASVGPAVEQLAQGISGDLAQLIEVSARKAAEAEAAFEEIDDVVDEHAEVVAASLANIVASVNEEQQEAAAGLTETLQTAKTVSTGVAVGTIAVLGLVLYFIARSIVLPIKRIVRSMTDGAVAVADASGQVNSSSTLLAEASSEQASSLEQTSSALEEMSAMTRTNATNAEEAANLVTKATDDARQSETEMTRLEEAMAAINESSDQISKIIKVIEEIAFQTNLLALNAAVEAARAGEHGKGFAVVADEVRNLAMRAAEAARETTGLIEASVTRAREGTDVSSGFGSALTAIVQNVTKVSDLVSHINQASSQQAQGVGQINSAVSQMDRVTQSMAASAEESASAVEELSAQADTVANTARELADVIGMENLNVDRRNTPAPGQANTAQGQQGASAGGGDSEPAKAAPTTTTGTEPKDEFIPLDSGDDNLNEF